MNNEKKMIYVNLWYDVYFEKTNAQLKSFRKLGFITHVMTIDNSDDALTCKVMDISDVADHAKSNDNIINSFSCDKSCNFGYAKIFKLFFDWVISEKYDFIYIRRLMSKLIFAKPYIVRLSKNMPIVYEIPTYPLDKTYDLILSLRNKVEFFTFSSIQKNLTLITTVLSDHISLQSKWFPMLNCIDIERFPLPSNAPDFSDTFNLLAVSNMARSHCYERLIYAISNYSGKYNIRLTLVSSETKTYKDIRDLVTTMNLNDKISFLPSKSIDEIALLSKDYHIGIGILTYGEKRRTIDTSLKNKDYCALGIPFISSCNDLSFPAPFKYHYLVSNDSYDIALEPIIEWYIDIRKDSGYKIKMYNYAKEKLQYDDTAAEIVNILSDWQR